MGCIGQLEMRFAKLGVGDRHRGDEALVAASEDMPHGRPVRQRQADVALDAAAFNRVVDEGVRGAGRNHHHVLGGAVVLAGDLPLVQRAALAVEAHIGL
eukprot:13129-Eustigmatos_ZCMA.PRE.1